MQRTRVSLLVILAASLFAHACDRSATQASQPISDLANFKVVSSRYFLRQSFLRGDEPVLEISVKNMTNSPISRAEFRGTLQSPSQTTPTLVADFTYEVDGVLAPGQKALWILAPGRRSEWGRVDAPRDANLSVELLRLE